MNSHSLPNYETYLKNIDQGVGWGPSRKQLQTSLEGRTKFKGKLFSWIGGYSQDNKEDYHLLENFSKAINELEAELLTENTKRAQERQQHRKKLEEKEQELQNASNISPSDGNKMISQMLEQAERLEKDNLATWSLYKESVSLGEFLLLEEDNKAPLSEDRKEEIRLLTDSLRFTIAVVKNENITQESLQAGIDIANQIEAHLNKPDARITDLEKRQRWKQVGIVLGAVLLVAAAAVFIGLTFGVGTVPAVLIGFFAYVLLMGAGFGTMGVNVKRRTDLAKEKRKIIEPKEKTKEFHHLSQHHATFRKERQEKAVSSDEASEKKPGQNKS